ncbi:MAG: hypothetical protein LC102_11745 [Ignavibacteriales bacterium]|nr:MAG: hypothetical protein F9K26_01010 [Ignavibacteriaceae bacterium]MBW7871991.1 hypothetical protein [Ignavibacteria bacterium]MCZ2144086.1 hypothetical protein [Ignavibacteriales bacterium]MBV6446113.1 hypothetical protein [Ignavibacteriaceae bacterium]MBZ0197395.1 hypothetical protein [Ignavibacteriaceae bacterium]
MFKAFFNKKPEKAKLEIELLGFHDSLFFKRLKEDMEKRLPISVEEFESLYDIEDAFNEQRQQYYTPDILKHLHDQNNGNSVYRMAILNVDIFNPVFKYLYGEAQLNGRISVVSLFRLHEELYTGQADSALLFQRALKEVYHEFGHNLGLIHCLDWDCVMHTSTSVEEIDIKGGFYCSNCFRQIKIS